MPDKDLATTIAALVALALVFQAAFGPSVMYITEALKGALHLPEGAGGLAAIVVGMSLGAGIGLITAIETDNTGKYTSVGFGLVAGLMAGAGAVKEYKAAGSTNIETSHAIETANLVAKSDAAYDELVTANAPILTSQGIHPSWPLNQTITKGDPEADYVDISKDDTVAEHTGQAIDVEPLADIPVPTHDYTGTPTDIPNHPDNIDPTSHT